MPIPLHGQAVGSGLSTPVALSDRQVNCVAFWIKAPRTNTATVYIGSSGVTEENGYPLEPGDEFPYERAIHNGQAAYQLRPSEFYLAAASPDRVAWLASPEGGG